MVTVIDVDATWVNPATTQYDAGELRRADSFFVSPGSIRLGPGADLWVTDGGSDTIDIARGTCIIFGDAAAAGTGAYRSSLATSVSATLAPRDTTNGRIDLVVFRVLDADVVPSHGAYTGRIEILTGTPSAAPVVPAKPDMAIELARITVPAEGGAGITVGTANREYACAVGGIITVPSSARLDDLTVPSTQRAYATDTDVLYAYDGTQWRVDRPFAALYGPTQVPSPDSNASVTLTFGFAQESLPAGFADSANNRLVAPRAGWYRVQASAEFDVAAAGVMTLQLMVNGTQVRMARGPAYGGSSKSPVHLHALVNLAEGDALTIVARQTSGAALAVTEKYFTAEFVHA